MKNKENTLLNIIGVSGMAIIVSLLFLPFGGEIIMAISLTIFAIAIAIYLLNLKRFRDTLIESANKTNLKDKIFLIYPVSIIGTIGVTMAIISLWLQIL